MYRKRVNRRDGEVQIEGSLRLADPYVFLLAQMEGQRREGRARYDGGERMEMPGEWPDDPQDELGGWWASGITLFT